MINNPFEPIPLLSIEECVVLFEFPDDALMSVVMLVTRDTLLIVQQIPGVAVPKTRRWEFVTPKLAYEQSR
jgi:hypothetical protein